MGFFTGAQKAADAMRMQGAAERAYLDFNRLKEFEISRIPNGEDFNNQQKALANVNGAFNKNTQDNIMLNRGKGFAQQELEKQYGLNTADAEHVVELARAKGGGAYTADLQKDINNKLDPARKAKAESTSQVIDAALFDAANDIGLSTNIKQKMFPSEYEKRIAGTALENLGIDISPNNKSKRSSDIDRVKLGDKDKRSFLAEEKLRIANDLAGGGFTRDQLVDMLNQPGVQQGAQYIDALNNDPRILAVDNMDSEGFFTRPEMEAPSFVGEGQFGRVTDLAPGYVSKKQEPLVEFGGYQTLDDGSMSPKGNLIGRIHDYRDVQDEVNQLNYLNDKAKGITPKVENFIIDDDGSTEIIMKDLRDNYGSSEEFLVDTAERFQNPELSTAERTKAYKDHKLFQVRQQQQEARAALAGVELQDRHMGNIMAHGMTNRPLQIDPSGRSVSGFERDGVVATSVVKGFQEAGLEQEAEIFDGLLRDAVQRQDSSAFHDLAQQGMSRLMKIKRIQ